MTGSFRDFQKPIFIRAKRELYANDLSFAQCGINPQNMREIPHSIGFSGGQLSSYVEGSSALDFPLIHDAQSQDPP
jgi:hypothetical protein